MHYLIRARRDAAGYIHEHDIYVRGHHGLVCPELHDIGAGHEICDWNGHGCRSPLKSLIVWIWPCNGVCVTIHYFIDALETGLC